MLISCVVYKDGERLHDIEVARIREFVTRPDCFVWVALKDPSTEELEQMRAQFDLHPLAVEDALKGNQRPKVDEYGPSLFAVLQMIEERADELVVGELGIFVGRNYVLSVRTKAERGFAEVRARSEREPELLKHGSPYVLYALMDAVVDRYFPVLDKVETELEQIEEQIFSNAHPRKSLESLYALKQRLMVIKHAVAPLLEGVANLSGARVPLMCAGMQEYFRDVYDHLQRLNQSIESARDTVATATSVNLTMIQLQENETMKRLAAYAALVAVPTMIAGIYGMNFEHMPELTWRWGYGSALALMALLDGLVFWRLRKAKWL
jgi:magnesium transporter